MSENDDSNNDGTNDNEFDDKSSGSAVWTYIYIFLGILLMISLLAAFVNGLYTDYVSNILYIAGIAMTLLAMYLCFSKIKMYAYIVTIIGTLLLYSSFLYISVFNSAFTNLPLFGIGIHVLSGCILILQILMIYMS